MALISEDQTFRSSVAKVSSVISLLQSGREATEIHLVFCLVAGCGLCIWKHGKQMLVSVIVSVCAST